MSSSPATSASDPPSRATTTVDAPADNAKGAEAGDAGEKTTTPTSATQNSEKAAHGDNNGGDDDKFLVNLNEDELPTSRPPLQKWLCLLVICSCAMCVTCASSMVSLGSFHISWIQNNNGSSS